MNFSPGKVHILQERVKLIPTAGESVSYGAGWQKHCLAELLEEGPNHNQEGVGQEDCGQRVQQGEVPREPGLCSMEGH